MENYEYVLTLHIKDNENHRVGNLSFSDLEEAYFWTESFKSRGFIVTHALNRIYTGLPTPVAVPAAVKKHKLKTEKGGNL